MGATPHLTASADAIRDDSATTHGDRSMLTFVVMGAAGGICAFMLSRMLNAGPFVLKPWYLDLPAEIILGSVAALFGVYMLTASDLAKTQTMIFALACGVSWSPIFTAAASYVSERQDNTTAGRAQDAQALASQIASQSDGQAEQSKQAAATQITGALQSLPSLSTAKARKAVVDSSNAVVNSISSSNPDATSVEALKTIGVASANSGATQTSLLTYTKLRQIATTSSVAGTKNEAITAMKEIARANPTLEKSAGVI